MQELNIKTPIKGRQEEFQLVGLAHATGFPILFIGPPGVGKTAILMDYCRAMVGTDDVSDRKFVLECNDDTKASEVKGDIDIDKMINENRIDYFSPIVDSDIVMINEVDKASSAVRHALFSIMQEKQLMLGRERKLCNWTVFCGSCNEIPEEEQGDPFWDRFLIKYDVERLTKEQIARFMKEGFKEEQEITVKIPTEEELNSISLDPDKLTTFANICYDQQVLTDRSITQIPRLVKAGMYVFNKTQNRAMVKIASIMCGHATAKSLSQEIEHPKVTQIMGKIENIPGMTRRQQVKRTIESIKEEIVSAYQNEGVSKEDIKTMRDELKRVVHEHPNVADTADEDQEVSSGQGSGENGDNSDQEEGDIKADPDQMSYQAAATQNAGMSN